MPDPADIATQFEAAVHRAARELAEEAARAVSEHPSVDDLIAYQESRLSEDRTETVRQHLTACPQCRDEFLQLAVFDAGDEAADLKPTPQETAADYAAFQARLGDGLGKTEVPVKPEGGSQPAPVVASNCYAGPGVRGWWTLAASLALALSGLWFWLAGFQKVGRNGAGAGETPKLFFADLVPEDEGQVRAGAGATAIEVPATMDTLVLRLNLGDQTPYENYRAEIPCGRGTAIWQQHELSRQPAGELVVWIRRADLPADRHCLRLVGETAGEQTSLATYAFELRYPTAP